MVSNADLEKFHNYDKDKKLVISEINYKLNGEFVDEFKSHLIMKVSLFDGVLLYPYVIWSFTGVRNLNISLSGNLDELSVFDIEEIGGQWENVRYKVIDREQSQKYFFYSEDARLTFE